MKRCMTVIVVAILTKYSATYSMKKYNIMYIRSSVFLNFMQKYHKIFIYAIIMKQKDILSIGIYVIYAIILFMNNDKLNRVT